MSKTEVTSRATPPALAEALKLWLPQAESRVIAVSETISLQQSQPKKLPLVMAYTQGEAVIRWSGDVPQEIREEIVVEIWQRAQKYEERGGEMLPLFKFYDHTTLRDQLYQFASQWESPAGAVLKPLSFSMDLLHETNTAAFVFKFLHEFRWCAPDDLDPPTAIDRIAACAMPKRNPSPDCCCTPDSEVPCEACRVNTWSPTE